MKSGRRLRRTLAGVLAAGALLTGAAGVIGAGIALSAAPANATPEEDCAAVRARDHQIYLNLIASLPPGAPIPPEYINPCLSAPSTTSTAAPTTTVGLPGVQAPGGGPNVGANAPTNFPTYNGTPIVPVPGAALSGQPNTPTPSGIENPAGVPVPTTTSGPAPTTPQPAGSTAPASTTDRGPGPVPASTPSNAPTQSESAPAVATSGFDEDDGRDRYLELVLVGAAAFTAAGMGVRGRPGPFSARVSARPWESVLSQVVGTVAKPFMPYFVGGQDVVVIPDPGGGQRTIFLIHDETSSHEAQMVVDLPPGGHMSINDDGSVGVYDANGDVQGTVAAAWAYDVNGDPVPTYYEIRDGKLYQIVVPTPGVIYPVTADGPYGGSDPVTGRDITATPLQGGGEVVNQSGGPVMVNVPTDSPYNDVGGIDPLGNLDMDTPTQPAPTTPLPFDIGSPTDSGTDTTAAAASEPPWNPLDNLDMDTPTQPDPPMELPFGLFDSDPNNGMISPTQSAQGHDVPGFSPDTDGAVTAGMLSAAEEAAERAAAGIGSPGRHSARAAEAIAASRSLVRLASRLPAIGVAVSVIDGALTIKGGGAIPETASAVTGGIAGGIFGAMGGARAAQAFGGGPISIVVGAGVGGFGGALSGSGLGHLLGRGARALWGGNK
ncbi:hypothetical protein [Rhodococcus sp. BH5]|uniref:hypothetical protein n=1 Tax=Rhodococcus sp. BH5 TaxID=2871702 RepID=UPI0022CD7163|nr:hypothetical protein [Rhodococcus sp. BH5]MCZ9634948.1 hypothetical protein [Rhodococcus sp. BH5]